MPTGSGPRHQRTTTITRIHPELPDPGWVSEAEAQQRERKAMFAGQTAAAAGLPDAFRDAHRQANDGDTITITIQNQHVTLVFAASGTGVDPDAEIACWQHLQRTLTKVLSAATSSARYRVGDWTLADLPSRIAVASWKDHHTTYVQGPSCTPRHRQIARRRKTTLPGIADARRRQPESR